MPANTRLASYRRKSSLINGLTPVKPGNYGIVSSPRPSPRGVVFAPNITPGTFTETEPPVDEDSSMPPSPSDALFPPSLSSDPAPSRRRVPPGKRRSQGYIPRPPNAFMLFRADFVRQKHVPGTIETNHGSLSKIIGNCWRALPLEEKKIWEGFAKQAKAKHQKLYPNYRFRPVHNKAKKEARDAAKAKAIVTPQDEQRCEDLANMLLDGKKGDELVQAVRDYDSSRMMSGSPMMHAPIPTHLQTFDPVHTYSPPPAYEFTRRPSSVPLPGISIPSLPFYMPNQQQFQSFSRPQSPISHYARSRMYAGSRRPSSAAPIMNRSWDMAHYYPGQLQQDDEPLPEVDASLFSNGFSWGASPEQVQDNSHGGFAMGFQQPDLALSISPLDSVSPIDTLTSASTAQSSPYPYYTSDGTDQQYNSMHWLPALDPTLSSGPSSAFSGSPARSETSLPMQPPVNLHAPKPQHPVAFETWEQHGVETAGMEHLSMHDEFGMDTAHLEFDPNSYAMGPAPDMYACGMDSHDNYPFHDELILEVPHY